MRGDFLIVAIGASAGGLEACTKFIKAIPHPSGMAFILVQHLDPNHDSMMAALLASHTSMPVIEATDGLGLEPDHLYVIPPGHYLSVREGALHVSNPQTPRRARLPFDVLLHSMAETCGPRAVCVVLSGTGADGSLGLVAVKEKGGLVIAQNPAEAGYDGMPKSAIATGAVDRVLPVSAIPQALLDRQRGGKASSIATEVELSAPTTKGLGDIIALLRSRTSHDFSAYKTGTLERRIHRRMAMAGIETADIGRYFEQLSVDSGEVERLAKDLLINVTSFFRDPAVFAYLAKSVLPELLRSPAPEQPLRLWIAGCSTGEEAYSLAMLFREAIAVSKRDLKLQIFASDVDPEAVAVAREGLYPQAIEADVSRARLTRFFSKEEGHYRVLPDLRALVVFTVQDLLADPPFSRLDLVSCRNLMIYLGPEAQGNIIALLHFALRSGGVLMLGSAETVGKAEGRFEPIAKAERLYRRIGHNRTREFASLKGVADGAKTGIRVEPPSLPPPQTLLAQLCQRLVLEQHAPAAVLVNRRHECVFSLGPIDRYLRVAPGQPSQDLLAMARQHVRAKLRSALQSAARENARVVLSGGRIKQDGHAIAFSIDVQPITSDVEDLFFICFVEASGHAPDHGAPVATSGAPRVADLERELDAARQEIQDAARSLDAASEEQKAINEEASSVREEYQSTNEELLASKEELQALIEELQALNGQLQETLERQRTTSNDLQNVLYSTDVATLFLDTVLNIRFFTPATKSLFGIIPTDVGRPLADLHSLAADGALEADARAVLLDSVPVEREVEAESGAWFVRRILPYRTPDKGVEGVVVTFTDITERKHAARHLEASQQQAEMANVAKSRFLAAASHDLRQPLQALKLMRGVLAKRIQEKRTEEALDLVTKFDDTTEAMSAMLDTLLDISQLEAGAIRAEFAAFPINDLLGRMRDEFTYHAHAQGLAFRAVPCGLCVLSDPRLLEQMIRNLLSNALKYTKRGKVLIGCRRHGERLAIEVWDTGIGIPQGQLKAIFDEYHQIDNQARERYLGLGLSIVQRLGSLMSHPVGVRSATGKGSVFTIEIKLASPDESAGPISGLYGLDHELANGMAHTGTILVIEDDPSVRDSLELSLHEEGYAVTTAPDGKAALDLVARGAACPDLILADYNLPGGLNGLDVTQRLRKLLKREIPIVILTGDISTEILRAIEQSQSIRLNKPVKLKDLTRAVRRLMPDRPLVTTASDPRSDNLAGMSKHPTIFVVDDDHAVSEAIRVVLEDDGRAVEVFATCEAFLQTYRPGQGDCLLIDAYLPGMDGFELLQRLRDDCHLLPAIMITGQSDVPMAVRAMKAGASDFIEKPVGRDALLASVARALKQSQDASAVIAWRDNAVALMAQLTARQREIMTLVLAGQPSKNIAADLGISQRTVENHRAAIMKRTGSKSMPALTRLALAASGEAEGTKKAPVYA